MTAWSTIGVANAIVSILAVNNTTTNATTTSSINDLSGGLSNRVQLVQLGTLNDPILLTQYPAVLVRAESKEEEPSSIGRSAVRRDIDASFEIYGLVQRPTGAEAVSESIKLSDNIEQILRNYVDLSQTVDQSNIVSTTWSSGADNAAMVQISTTKFTTKSISRT